VRRYMTEQHREFFGMLPYAFLGTVDVTGQPWASIIVGQPGFAQAVDPNRLEIAARPLFGDPLNETLREGAEIAFLGVQLPTRRRNRAIGVVVDVKRDSFAIVVRQTLGVCPQYIQGREASFTDDPTRILRLARYAQRTGFSVEAGTAELASQATLATVSGARIGAELALILRERDPLGVLEGLQAKLPIVVERALVERALALAPADADRDLLILAAVMRDGRAGAEWLESLELGARARDVLVAAPSAASLARDLAAAAQPSSIRSLVQGVPVELVALAGALGAGDAVSRWFGELRHITLQITGDDLLAAGLAQSPEIGARLERTLNLRLDGALDAGREAELASALGEG